MRLFTNTAMLEEYIECNIIKAGIYIVRDLYGHP